MKEKTRFRALLLIKRGSRIGIESRRGLESEKHIFRFRGVESEQAG